MSGTGWRAGAAGAVVGALATWVAAPWVSMAVRGTVDDRHATWLRRQGDRPVDRPDGGTAGSPGPARMPRAWDTIPGPRPQVRARPGRTGRAGAASS